MKQQHYVTISFLEMKDRARRIDQEKKQRKQDIGKPRNLASRDPSSPLQSFTVPDPFQFETEKIYHERYQGKGTQESLQAKNTNELLEYLLEHDEEHLELWESDADFVDLFNEFNLSNLESTP